MPKKANQLTEDEQSKRFRRKVKELINAGELNPTDADKMLDRMVRKSIKDHGA